MFFLLLSFYGQSMNSNDLTQGSILGNIRKFSVPYMLSYFLQILYGLADLFVIGQYCDVDSTTAVSNSGQVMYMITVVLIGLAMGTTVCVARAIGAKDNQKAAGIIGNTVTLFIIIAVALSGILLLLRRDIVAWLDTPQEAISGAIDYLTVCFIGIPFIIAYNIIASIFRGLGDSKSPMYFVAVACFANIAFDFLFIGTFGLGPTGAALGTTLSQALSVLFAIIAIRKRKLLPSIRKSDFQPNKKTISTLLRIGFPVALQDGFIQISFLAITVIANNRGLNDAAAVGIVEKFIGLLFIIPSAMLATVSTMAAQNIGANQMDRAKATMKYAMAIAVCFGIIVSIILQFIPNVAVSIFTNDNTVIAMGGEYLRGYTWDCALAGMHFCFSGFFTACGLSTISFSHNFASIITARIPLAYLASTHFPDTLYPMGLATVTGSLVSVIICLFAYKWLNKKNRLA